MRNSEYDRLSKAISDAWLKLAFQVAGGVQNYERCVGTLDGLRQAQRIVEDLRKGENGDDDETR